MSAGLAKCFFTFFRVTNKAEKALNYNTKSLEVIAFDRLVGLDSLWKILLESQNEKAIEESRELLVDLY